MMLRDGYDTPLTSCVKFVCLGPNACDCLERSGGGKAPHEGFRSQLFVGRNEACCMLNLAFSAVAARAGQLTISLPTCLHQSPHALSRSAEPGFDKPAEQRQGRKFFAATKGPTSSVPVNEVGSRLAWPGCYSGRCLHMSCLGRAELRSLTIEPSSSRIHLLIGS